MNATSATHGIQRHQQAKESNKSIRNWPVAKVHPRASFAVEPYRRAVWILSCT